MIEEQLIAIINTYNSDGYYKYQNIPSKKLQAAIQNYPVDPSDTPLALIDTTVFGSAKTGMVIGLKGVYFKNDWTTKTDKNFLTWEELSSSHSSISNGAMNCIMLIPGCEINMSGSSMKKDLLINLLNQIIGLYKNVSVNNNSNVTASETTVDNNLELIENQKGNISAKQYEDVLPELIALCITADGDIEDSEVELATAIIEDDDIIEDKQVALESLMLNIDKFLTAKSKSNAIFKLNSSTTIAKVTKITDTLQKERLEIVLEGMLETVKDEGVSETENIIEAIRKKL